jgi:hypothetical protein
VAVLASGNFLYARITNHTMHCGMSAALGTEDGGRMTPSEFFKWLAIEFDSWDGWDWFRTHEGEENIQKIEWFEVSEHMEADHSDIVDEVLEVETICLCCGQRPEACDNNGLSLP